MITIIKDFLMMNIAFIIIPILLYAFINFLSRGNKQKQATIQCVCMMIFLIGIMFYVVANIATELELIEKIASVIELRVVLSSMVGVLIAFAIIGISGKRRK